MSLQSIQKTLLYLQNLLRCFASFNVDINSVFIKVYQRISTLQGHETFLPWLLRVARNVCIDHLRRRKVRPPAVDVPVEDGPELADPKADPHEHWAVEDRKRLVYRALEKMSDQDREIILLKEIQGLDLKEVAEMLGIPVGTVKSRSPFRMFLWN